MSVAEGGGATTNGGDDTDVVKAVASPRRRRIWRPPRDSVTIGDGDPSKTIEMAPLLDMEADTNPGMWDGGKMLKRDVGTTRAFKETATGWSVVDEKTARREHEPVMASLCEFDRTN